MATRHEFVIKRDPNLGYTLKVEARNDGVAYVSSAKEGGQAPNEL